MTTIETGVLSAVGSTPLVRLTKLFPQLDIELYAKLEGLNPGGSAKDRPARSMIQAALAAGQLRPDTVVIESSSGNMGIGLAQACSSLGLRFICVVDPKTTSQNARLLKAYGAEVEIVPHPDPTTGEYLQARLNRVRELRETIPNSFWPNQYDNLANPCAHRQTMAEIHRALGRDPSYVFCATSTCGTLRGCSDYIRDHDLRTTLVAVDAAGSAIFDNRKIARLIPGHGAGVRPPLFQPDLADTHVIVSDADCVIGCRQLVRAEGILAGGSSGAVVMAVQRMSDRIPPGSTCTVILPDRGERYLDTVFSDEWVAEHFDSLMVRLADIDRTRACATAI